MPWIYPAIVFTLVFAVGACFGLPVNGYTIAATLAGWSVCLIAYDLLAYVRGDRTKQVCLTGIRPRKHVCMLVVALIALGICVCLSTAPSLIAGGVGFLVGAIMALL